MALAQPLITVMSYNDDIKQAGAYIAEIRAITDAPEMERPKTAPGVLPLQEHGVELKNVHFAYREKEVLHGISMKIPDKAYVSIVGPSGSGKSTAARLIAGLWDVQEGEILMGGIDSRQIPMDDWDDSIAYVSQNNYLFNETIRENIRMGMTKRRATDEEVEEVAKKCGCHDFIMGLENGYDTAVGSGGGHLSGGEQQRICIARAMLKDAPVIILDEATAYTDPKNEALIQESVSRLVADRTLIVIAHRLSAIQNADRIFVMDGGNIAEQGTHQELLQKNGLYKRMWEAHISARDRGGGADDRNYQAFSELLSAVKPEKFQGFPDPFHIPRGFGGHEAGGSLRAAAGRVRCRNYSKNGRCRADTDVGQRCRLRNPEEPENHSADRGRLYDLYGKKNGNCRASSLCADGLSE